MAAGAREQAATRKLRRQRLTFLRRAVGRVSGTPTEKDVQSSLAGEGLVVLNRSVRPGRTWPGPNVLSASASLSGRARGCGRRDDETGSLRDDIERPNFGGAGAGVEGAMHVPKPLVDEHLSRRVSPCGAVVPVDDREAPALDDDGDRTGVSVPVRSLTRRHHNLLD